MSHCIHYGACGGCATDNRSNFDKAPMLYGALMKSGYSRLPMTPLVETPLRTRRRVDLGVTRSNGAITLGLHRARSAEVIDMTECVLLLPQLLALMAPLRVLLRSLEAMRRVGGVQINWLDTGPDILLRLDADLTGPDVTKIIAFARAQCVLRVSFAMDKAPAELVVMLNPPIITLSGVAVQPPPGAFLQASRAGEAAIVQAVLAGLPALNRKSRIVELFAGIGTLTFALAGRARVEAYEGAADAVAAQEAALRAANLAGKIALQRRDLARRPLQPAEMAGRVAVVLDPPYAGASAQMKFLVLAKVPRIIYVSCNPAALANDVWELRSAGYKMLSVTPIDQFAYSENVESVAVFGS